MAADGVLEGGCLCGGLRFQVRGAPENVRNCHCRLCQKAMGSPFFARALYARGQVSVTGRTARYPSSSEMMRVFCPECGTRVLTERIGHIALALAAFDDPDALRPDCHFMTAYKIGWMNVDDLPAYPEWGPD